MMGIDLILQPLGKTPSPHPHRIRTLTNYRLHTSVMLAEDQASSIISGSNLRSDTVNRKVLVGNIESISRPNAY